MEVSLGLIVLEVMKAIMAQTFARTAGVKISVANAFLKALEAKGIIKNVGGNSGNKVYKLEKLWIYISVSWRDFKVWGAYNFDFTAVKSSVTW